jgi:hypothetical protein
MRNVAEKLAVPEDHLTHYSIRWVNTGKLPELNFSIIDTSVSQPVGLGRRLQIIGLIHTLHGEIGFGRISFSEL